ncbi:MAG: InlB B-repeat-containing protein [Clostridiales Family XIII bacterium]|jgi:uncharacterized repeat protein (TIGR02543 family)|nr:InlB B-repeat-containing protein [Clostridiales Family XIII bacterium]
MRTLYLLNRLISIIVIATLFAASASSAAAATPTVKGTIVYDANGGVGGETARNISEGTTLIFPKVSRTGYTKKGWFTAKIGGVEVDKKTVVNFGGRGIVTYYAQWTAKKLMLKYNLDKGRLPSGTPNYKEITVDGTYGKLPVPMRSGHKFLGWYSGSEKITASTKVTKTRSHNITAKWIKQGSGSTITDAEYKRLKIGISPDDAKYTVGGIGFSAKKTINGHTYIVYLWNAASGKGKGTLAVFRDGELIRKSKGKYTHLIGKLEEWIYDEYYDVY